MRIYLVYDMKDKESFVTRGTARAVAKVLDVHPYKVRDYARVGSLIKRRYRVIRERDEDYDFDNENEFNEYECNE